MRLFLFSDLDYTAHHPEAPQNDNALADYLDDLSGQGVEVFLCYVTGRSYPNLVEKITPTPIPKPSYAICGVGTQVHHFGSGKIVEQWETHLALQEKEGWSHGGIQQAAEKFFAAHSLAVPPLDPAWHLPHKLTYLVENMTQESLAALQKSMEAEGFKVNLVYSADIYLDILPGGCNKGLAIDWFVKEHGIVAQPGDVVVFAGDSGNDIEGFSAQALTHRIVLGERPEVIVPLTKNGLLEKSIHMKDGFGPVELVKGLRQILG